MFEKILKSFFIREVLTWRCNYLKISSKITLLFETLPPPPILNFEISNFVIKFFLKVYKKYICTSFLVTDIQLYFIRGLNIIFKKYWKLESIMPNLEFLTHFKMLNLSAWNIWKQLYQQPWLWQKKYL